MSTPGSIPPDRSKIVFFFFWVNKKESNHMFFIVLSSLSNSFRFLFTQKKNICPFLSQSFKGFLPRQLVRHFYPFFLFILHAFMHFHQKILKVRTKRILGFLMILSVLMQFVGWVFVHASYKHDSHALISKFSWFVQNFEIKVYVFLRNLEILFNYMELSKISLWYCLIE